MDRLKKISIAAVGFLLAASFAFADEAGRFVSVEGRVDLLKAGASEAVAASADDIVSAGDIVRTKGRSKAEIDFADKSSLKIGENSRVQIKEYSVENGKRTSSAILVERGGIRATVSKTSGKNDFAIYTPNAAGSVKGTDLFVTFQKSATNVLVVSGKFSVANLAFPDKVVNITSGNVTLIPADEPPQAPREYLALEKSNYEIFTEPAKEATAEGYTEPGEMKATVTAVSGRVQIKSRGSITWRNAKLSELLSAGDTIETKENGNIEIRLENGNAINLKQDSQLVLQKLTQDIKTGDYENIFESSRGRLRAKVSKLKGDSKFEIKTPTAIAGVRGTIMFLNIIPGLTSSYFEEGNGYVQSTISGVSKVVTAGNYSSADANGNVTDPQPPSDAERSGWQEGWETGGDTGDSGDGSNVNTGNNSNPPVDDPIRVENPPIPPPLPPPVPPDWNGTFSGDIHDTSGNISGTVSGKYSRPTGGNWGSWSSDSSGTYSSAPSSAWSAIMAGSGDTAGDLYWAGTMSGSAWASGVLSATIEGVALHDISLGEISGNSTGVYGAGTWSTDDSGTYEEIVDLTTLGITEINLSGNGWGLIGSALMAGVFGGETVETTSSTGTFKGILAGTGSPTGTWKLALGMTDYYAGAADGYALATADNVGVFYCVYFGEPWSSTTFTLGKATGSIGTINTVDTTWNANVTSGAWVDLAVLTTSALGFTQATLADMVSVPITETYASLLNQTGSVVTNGTILSMTMDMSFYTGGTSGGQQIWTALFSGNYTGTPDPGWVVMLDGTDPAFNAYAAILTNGTWSGNTWTADVDEDFLSGVLFSGQAGGTYTGGTLTGVGAGTWTKP